MSRALLTSPSGSYRAHSTVNKPNVTASHGPILGSDHFVDALSSLPCSASSAFLLPASIATILHSRVQGHTCYICREQQLQQNSLGRTIFAGGYRHSLKNLAGGQVEVTTEFMVHALRSVPSSPLRLYWCVCSSCSVSWVQRCIVSGHFVHHVCSLCFSPCRSPKSGYACSR